MRPCPPAHLPLSSDPCIAPPPPDRASSNPTRPAGASWTTPPSSPSATAAPSPPPLRPRCATSSNASSASMATSTTHTSGGRRGNGEGGGLGRQRLVWGMRPCIGICRLGFGVWLLSSFNWPATNSAGPCSCPCVWPQADREAGAGAAPQHLLPPLHALHAGQCGACQPALLRLLLRHGRPWLWPLGTAARCWWHSLFRFAPAPRRLLCRPLCCPSAGVQPD